ncbi:Uncharacterised protein [uncultured archaeon]|nr:Uncharacterised protein [uncultured archaeon]
MYIKLFWELLVLAAVTCGAARWVYKFIQTILAGGYTWIQGAIAFGGAVGFGVSVPIISGVPLLIPVAIVGFLAVIQVGYEILAKPLLKLGELAAKFFDYLVNKLETYIAINNAATSTATTDTTITA